MTTRMVNERGRTFAYVTYGTAAGFVLAVFFALLVDHDAKVADVAPALYTGFAGIIAAGTAALGYRAGQEAKNGTASGA